LSILFYLNNLTIWDYDFNADCESLSLGFAWIINNNLCEELGCGMWDVECGRWIMMFVKNGLVHNNHWWTLQSLTCRSLGSVGIVRGGCVWSRISDRIEPTDRKDALRTIRYTFAVNDNTVAYYFAIHSS
jgi:hypothetical protein